VQNQAIILAAGKGTRMHSERAKVLHNISGKPMIDWQLERLAECGVARANLVVGYRAEEVRARARDCAWVHPISQTEQLGTGHATRLGLEGLAENGPVVVLAGDIPFISSDLLKRVFEQAARNRLALVTTRLSDPTGYGRVVRDASGHRVAAIVEEADADEATKAIDEVYCGILAATPKRLKGWLAGLNNNNAQGEYYLPEIVPAAIADGIEVVCVEARDRLEVEGVNSLTQLVELERERSFKLARELLARGVYVADPVRLDIRGELTCGRDVRLDPNVIINGRVELADGVEIGAGCVLEDCAIGTGSRIEPMSHIAGARIGKGCAVGPFARLRSDADLLDSSKVGNFVEVKNTRLGEGSKANHLAYLGDAETGRGVNIGAGTITCNYDGVAKHRTSVGDGVFIGSNAALVAPVRIGDGALIGAGSVITRDVSAGDLGLGRARQINKKRDSE